MNSTRKWTRNCFRRVRACWRVRTQICARDEHSLPPELKPREKLFTFICYVGGVLALLVTVDQYIPADPLTPYVHSSPAVVYVSIPILLACIVCERYLLHTKREFRERIEDRSEIEGILRSAHQLEPRVRSSDSTPEKPDDFTTRSKWCQEEASQVKNLTAHAWTEISIVPLLQHLVDFLKIEDLRGEADNLLADLDDYARSTRTPYDIRQYEEWNYWIEEAKEEIKKPDDADEIERDKSAERLRARVKILYEHVALYKRTWSQGSAIVTALRTICVLTIPLLLLLALTPFCHPSGEQFLAIKHWAVLGVVGSLTAILYQLRNSDLVEIGNTEGTGELRQAIGATALGLVAGILVWSLIAANFFGNGGLIPDVARRPPIPQTDVASYLGKSLAWGIAAGFSLQRVFGRLRAATFGD